VKIGLTYTGSPEKQENYIRWLKGNEDIEIIQLAAENRNADAVKDCDALVLTGGVDIHPKFYRSKKTGYPNHPDKFNEERDEFEIGVFHLTQENKIPVLGICRGFQLINCIFGGTLKQDLGAGLNKIHWSEKKKDDKAHGLHIETGTLMNDIVQTERIVVNSAHHQAVKKLGKGLKLNCRADDGTIEGFEWANKPGKPFLLCIQWHPERMFKFGLQDSPLVAKIRERFIEEIKKSIANRQ
jgi:putative glutamine amidotransferase